VTGDTLSVDIAMKENMEALISIDKDLLKKSVSKVNIGTGMFKSVPIEDEVVIKEKVLDGESNILCFFRE
jgi:predicted nucleotidyltransferase